MVNLIIWLIDYIFFRTQNTPENRNENNTTMEIPKVAAEVKTTTGEGDKFLLKFEKFVSEKKVAFFSEKMDTSKYRGKFIEMNYYNTIYRYQHFC